MIPTPLLADIELETLLSGAAQAIAVGGVIFVLLALLFSHLRYENLAEQAHKAMEASLTPLDVFRIQVSRLLGTLHKDPPPFTLAVFSLQHADALRANHGENAAEQGLAEMTKRLRAITRAGDVVISYSPTRIGVALALNDDRSAAVLLRLINDAAHELVEMPDTQRIRLELAAAAVHFPLHGRSVEELRLRAENLLEERLKQGAGPALVLEPDSPSPASYAADETPASGPHLDPLTGVLAFRELGPAMQKFLANYRKDGLPSTFLVIDVDSLESYNNHYGRAAGDVILKSLCRMLERNTREGDLIGRLDGEEFVVAMNAKPKSAEAAAVRLNGLVKREQIDFGQNKLRITISIGVAGYPDHGAIAKLLFERAEIALYDAKMRGRNTVSVFAPTMSLPQARQSQRVSAEAY